MKFKVKDRDLVLLGVMIVIGESSSSPLEVFILTPHHFKYHDRKVGNTVARGIEMGSYQFVNMFVSDIAVMSTETDVEWILRLTNVLHVTKIALN